MKIGVCGNLTIDELHRHGRKVVRPGGSALYTSLAATYLGAKVSVVSNVGRDFPRKVLSLIRGRGVDTASIQRFDGPTTRFRISYVGDLRRLELIRAGQRLESGHISSSLQAIHLGPVFNELGLDVLAYARGHSEFLSVDVQGLLRTAGQDGLVRLKRRSIAQFLSKCNLVKATEEEARMVAPAATMVATARKLLWRGAQYGIITRGRSGSILVKKSGSAFHIPSVPENDVADLTGAGDIFIGSWLATFLSVRDALWAAAVGAAFASLSVRRIGISKFGFARGELFRRAAWAYMNSRVVRS